MEAMNCMQHSYPSSGVHWSLLESLRMVEFRSPRHQTHSCIPPLCFSRGMGRGGDQNLFRSWKILFSWPMCLLLMLYRTPRYTFWTPRLLRPHLDLRLKERGLIWKWENWKSWRNRLRLRLRVTVQRTTATWWLRTVGSGEEIL